jgi:GDP-D-mannose dehydratase
LALSPEFSRDPRSPAAVDFLFGDPGKARARLGGRRTTTFRALVHEMVAADCVMMKRDGQKRQLREAVE